MTSTTTARTGSAEGGAERWGPRWDHARRTGRRARSSSSRHARRRSAASESAPACTCSSRLRVRLPPRGGGPRRGRVRPRRLTGAARPRARPRPGGRPPRRRPPVPPLRTTPSTSSRGSTPSSSPTTWSPRSREAARVAMPGGAVVIQVWGAHGRCDLDAIKPIVRPLFPGYDPGAPPPPDLAQARSARGSPAAAGLTPTEAYDVRWAWHEDDDALLRGMLSAGGVGDAAGPREDVAAALLEALAPFRAADGTYRLENEWHTLLATARGGYQGPSEARAPRRASRSGRRASRSPACGSSSPSPATGTGARPSARSRRSRRPRGSRSRSLSGSRGESRRASSSCHAARLRARAGPSWTSE